MNPIKRIDRFPESFTLFWSILLASGLSGCVNPGFRAAINCDTATLHQVLSTANHGDMSRSNISLSYYYMAEDDCIDGVKEFLAAGARPDDRALAVAAEKGHERVARLLIDHGLEPTAAMLIVRRKAEPAEVATAEEVFRNIASNPSTVAVSSAPAQPTASGTTAPWWSKSESK